MRNVGGIQRFDWLSTVEKHVGESAQANENVAGMSAWTEHDWRVTGLHEHRSSCEAPHARTPPFSS